MYPVLWHLPLPAWAVPLSPTLVALALVGVVLVLIGWRYRATDLTFVGALAALGGSAAAMSFKGQQTTLTALPVTSYGAMLCVALLAGWYLATLLGRREGLPRDLMATSFFVAAVSGFIGARILYVLTNAGEVASFADAVNARRGGLTGYGALVVGFVATFWFVRRRGVRVWAWADVATPGLAVGVVLTRIGCYLLGSDFGRPLGGTSPGWLQRLGTFPHWPPQVLDGIGAPAWVHHVSQGLVPLEADRSLPVHPTELYEVFAGLGLVVLSLVGQRWRTQRGRVFCTWVFAYGVVRWVVDALRDDPEQGRIGPYFLEHRYLPLGLLVLGLAWAFGPAEAVARLPVRRVVQALGLLPAVVAYSLLVPPAFAPAPSVQVSISQWTGLVSALLAAGALRWLRLEAAVRPEAAGSVWIGLPTGPDPGPAEERSPASEAESSDVPRRPRKPRHRRARV
jgi:phosphatidylglycerol:prolipoprotein diacylglycerol transferase